GRAGHLCRLRFITRVRRNLRHGMCVACGVSAAVGSIEHSRRGGLKATHTYDTWADQNLVAWQQWTVMRDAPAIYQGSAQGAQAVAERPIRTSLDARMLRAHSPGGNMQTAVRRASDIKRQTCLALLHPAVFEFEFKLKHLLTPDTHVRWH